MDRRVYTVFKGNGMTDPKETFDTLREARDYLKQKGFQGTIRSYIERPIGGGQSVSEDMRVEPLEDSD